MLQAAIQFEQLHMWILSIFQCVWFCQKSGTFICVELYLGLHFYPVVKQAYFYAKTMHAVFNYALAVPLESGIVIPPVVLLLFQIVLAILEGSCLHSKLIILFFFNSCKELCWNFHEDCIEFVE